jgi:hypothetical protein
LRLKAEVAFGARPIGPKAVKFVVSVGQFGRNARQARLVLGLRVTPRPPRHRAKARAAPALAWEAPRCVQRGENGVCYAKSEKSWIDDPAGISWETFHTTGESTDYGDGSGERVARVAHEKSCCAPAPEIAEPVCGCS